MSPVQERRFARRIVTHLVMGLALGGTLAAALLYGGADDIRDMIVHSASPMTMTAIFFGVWTSVFAVGTGLTGLVLELATQETGHDSR